TNSAQITSTLTPTPFLLKAGLASPSYSCLVNKTTGYGQAIINAARRRKKQQRPKQSGGGNILALKDGQLSFDDMRPLIALFHHLHISAERLESKNSLFLSTPYLPLPLLQSQSRLGTRDWTVTYLRIS
ncbi:hypothetical protein CEXT_443791, partial [Caerostris extrusa]